MDATGPGGEPAGRSSGCIPPKWSAGGWSSPGNRREIIGPANDTLKASDWPAIIPCCSPSGIQNSGIHIGRLALVEEAALTPAHRQKRTSRFQICGSMTAQISPFCLLKVIAAKTEATAPNGGSCLRRHEAQVGRRRGFRYSSGMPKNVRARWLAGQTRRLLRCGMWAGPVFTATFLAEGTVRDGYRPLRHPVSSLALGPRGWIQTVNFAVTGALTLSGAAGLRLTGDRLAGSRAGTALVAAAGAGLIASAVFPTDPVGGYPPGTPDMPAGFSRAGTAHNLAAIPVFLGLPRRGAGYGWRSWRAGQTRGFALYSVATGLIMPVTMMLAGQASASHRGWAAMAACSSGPASSLASPGSRRCPRGHFLGPPRKPDMRAPAEERSAYRRPSAPCALETPPSVCAACDAGRPSDVRAEPAARLHPGGLVLLDDLGGHPAAFLDVDALRPWPTRGPCARRARPRAGGPADRAVPFRRPCGHGRRTAASTLCSSSLCAALRSIS